MVKLVIINLPSLGQDTVIIDLLLLYQGIVIIIIINVIYFQKSDMC